MKMKKEQVVGEYHNEILNKITKLFLTQYNKDIENGIRGFLLYGPPGTGKSTIAKRVIYDIHFTHLNSVLPDNQCYRLLNLADIAKSRFGETENIIRTEFETAMKRAKDMGTFFIIVMDDVDGMFPSRSYGKLDAWYLGHLNVLFTELDKLETDKVGIIMTTNRKDLLDDAVISRIIPYEIASIDYLTARINIEERISELKMDNSYAEKIFSNLQNKFGENHEGLSFREIEKEIILEYVNWIETEDI